MIINYAAPVLVVDDQIRMVDLAKRLLSRLGFEQVHHECDGEKALARLRSLDYQLVLCDMHMQPISGLQFLRSIRQEDALKMTRFILMTGSVEPSAVKAAKLAGADAYILKPFTHHQLQTKVEEVFSRERRSR